MASSETLLEAFNPFRATGLFLYPLKRLEDLWFSDVLRGYRKRPVALGFLMLPGGIERDQRHELD